MDKIFQIGGFAFRVISPAGLPVPEHFLLFEAADEKAPEFTYRITVVNRLPLPEGSPVAERPDLAVYEAPGGECRLIGMAGQEGWYACYEETDGKQAGISLTSSMLPFLQYDTVFTSLFALERHMLRKRGLVLHCACVRYRGRAILFSAPSGVGKSTQADLWEKYRGSITMNGDRALLQKKDGIWHACGWPVCGSSGICHTGDTPVGAIVMLRQGKENHAEPLSPVQAFTQLYGQITVNQWNPASVPEAVGILEDLVQSVPVFLLACDMTEGAVQCLEHALFPDHAGK